MEFYQEVIANLLSREQVQIVFPNVTQDPNAMVEMTCYQALKKIKAVLEDETLDDPTCFVKIEKIIEALEDIGSGARNRHDFG